MVNNQYNPSFPSLPLFLGIASIFCLGRKSLWLRPISIFRSIWRFLIALICHHGVCGTHRSTVRRFLDQWFCPTQAPYGQHHFRVVRCDAMWNCSSFLAFFSLNNFTKCSASSTPRTLYRLESIKLISFFPFFLFFSFLSFLPFFFPSLTFDGCEW